MANNDRVCCVFDCNESPIETPIEFDYKYGLKLALCKTHSTEFFQKFSQKNALLGGVSGKAGGNLNIVGILANALSNYTTEDKSKKLKSILSIRLSKDVGGAITALIDQAGAAQDDLSPGANSTGIEQAMNMDWWNKFFEATHIYQPANKQWLIQYVANQSRSVRESINEATDADDEEEADDDEDEKPRGNFLATAGKYAANKIQGVRNFLDAGPTGTFGKKKNALVAKLAVAGAVELYERAINSILAKMNLSEKDIPIMYNIYDKYIMPIFMQNGTVTETDMNKLAKGDAKLLTVIKNSYVNIDKLSKELRAAKI